ncbi:MAG: hypothetical protein AAF213_12395 [Pseudomonadota bacterium]
MLAVADFLPLLVKTLIVSGIMVPVMIYLVVPFCRRSWRFSSLVSHDD